MNHNLSSPCLGKFPLSFCTGSTLKIIAIVTMFIDHLGAAFLRYYINTRSMDGIVTDAQYEQFQQQTLLLGNLYDMMRAIGRLAFPIFCFLLIEGFLHTHDLKKYTVRLFLFALLSELPFDLAFSHSAIYLGHQNVFFTLLIGILVLTGFQAVEQRCADNQFLMSLLEMTILVIGCLIAYYLKTDYNYIGILVIAVMYLFRCQPFVGSLIGCVLLYLYNTTEFPALFIPFLLLFYNGQRGSSIKYFFYLFYPLHLLVLYFLYRVMVA